MGRGSRLPSIVLLEHGAVGGFALNLELPRTHLQFSLARTVEG